MKRLIFVVLLLSFTVLSISAQTVTKSFAGTVSGASCPSIGTQYEVTRPSGFTSCQITWSATNGTIPGSKNGTTVNVTWDDTPGSTGTVTATFSNCATGDSGNNGKTASLSELILSVKDQAWGSSNNPVTVDYCTPNRVNISVSHMYVQGTGGIAQPPLQEVVYQWTLPSGWREFGTGRTGTFGTYVNAIAIEPIGCSVPGTVSVQGIINVPPIACGSAGPSSTNTISLNGASPFATITVPQGYTGSRACDTNPVTFTALLSPSLGCVSGYSWTLPPGSGWTQVSQSGNTITLRPSGNSTDALPITATISLTCGSTLSGVLSVPFTNPTIGGPSLVCATETYSIQNAAPNPTIAWSTNTVGLSINSSGVAARQNGYSGSATVSATVCGIAATPKVVFVGTPLADNSTLLWTGTRGVNPVQLTPGNTYIFRGDYVLGAASYTWVLPSGFTALGGNTTTTNPSIYITTSSVSGTYTLYCSATNSCGSNYTHSLTINNGSTGGGGTGCPPGVRPPCKPGPGPLRVATSDDAVFPETAFALTNPVVYPNPTNRNFTVSLVQEEDKSIEGTLDAPVQLVLYNLLQQVVYQANTVKSIVTIPAENLPSEIYYLSIAYKKEVIRQRVAVVH